MPEDTINHSNSFVNYGGAEVDGDQIDVHTQTIENAWGRLKAKLRRKRGIRRNTLQMQINEAQWLIENRNAPIAAMSQLLRFYINS